MITNTPDSESYIFNKNNSANGLQETVSVLENNKQEQPAHTSDILYNPEERLQEYSDLYHEGECLTYSDYDPVDFGQPITLLSTITYDT